MIYVWQKEFYYFRNNANILIFCVIVSFLNSFCFFFKLLLFLFQIVIVENRNVEKKENLFKKFLIFANNKY